MPSTKSLTWISLGVFCSISVSAYLGTIPSSSTTRRFILQRRPFHILYSASSSSNTSPDDWDNTQNAFSSEQDSMETSSSSHPSSFSASTQRSSTSSSSSSPFGNRSPITFSQTSSSSSYQGVLDGVGGILPLESISPSPERIHRMKREADLKNKFIHGDQLVNLRQYMDNLMQEIQDMKKNKSLTNQEGSKNEKQFLSLNKALQDAREMDAEYMYQVYKEHAVQAEERGDIEEAKEWRKQASDARACLPQFNLEGLWVGKYGDHGYEMINVTYVGDTLVATKVTGDKNVPKGQMTFTTDLDPSSSSSSTTTSKTLGNKKKILKPIELTDVAAKQWGQKYLHRFTGKGQVASEGFVNREWMEGQLILVGEYFSFAWIPIGYQIFFGRPSAELTLKMLKQSRMIDFGAVATAELAEKRAYVQKCFDETELLLDEECSIDGIIIHSEDDLQYLADKGGFQ